MKLGVKMQIMRTFIVEYCTLYNIILYIYHYQIIFKKNIFVILKIFQNILYQRSNIILYIQ